jgi:hypothetical protein
LRLIIHPNLLIESESEVFQLVSTDQFPRLRLDESFGNVLKFLSDGNGGNKNDNKNENKNDNKHDIIMINDAKSDNSNKNDSISITSNITSTINTTPKKKK